jgi:acetyl-CoA carboxylase carboxyltransferase component
LAEDEHHAIALAREIVANLNHKKKTPLPPDHLVKRIEPPLYDPQEILGIAAADLRKPFDSREIIARIVDGSRFSEFKPVYGPTLVTCWARIHGFNIGILANNGVRPLGCYCLVGSHLCPYSLSSPTVQTKLHSSSNYAIDAAFRYCFCTM